MTVKGLSLSGSTTAVRLTPAPADTVSGSSGTITNTGSVPMVLGDSTVTAAGGGYHLAIGGSVPYQIDQTESIWGVGTAAWTADVLAQGV